MRTPKPPLRWYIAFNPFTLVTMSEFVPGQRWVVDSEPELGLGTVTHIEGRSVRIYFELGSCERNYALDQAPLTRIHYAVEDEIETSEGDGGRIVAVEEHQGLYFYRLDNEKIIPETALSSEIQLNQPFMRLMTGQLDKPGWFFFKRQLSDAISRVWQSRLNGLLGVRANLIPHQLYVAWSACERERVRVLLADEVGLGKTIEAASILSRLSKLERVNRALIAVPAALQVQWLVELVRRFALHPELYQGDEHDFASGRIHIVPHAIFAQKKTALAAGEFDIVIVDEAHHLTPGSDEFQSLSLLAATTEHVVLLTATPEQLGMASHFARLQLLDAAKFSNYEAFVAQEQHHIELNQDIRNLPATREKILRQYKISEEVAADDQTLIAQLLDCHGVGRVMFRNVRAAIAGFPQRLVHAPALDSDDWATKYEWLAGWLKKHNKNKTLVICHQVEQVFACEDYLWKKHGLDAAVFHEQQSLIERDRAAAYFSDAQEGCQVLICSEIGSEGRNFQFCCQLICLDLPDHPDLLEQRIGRLDRIGQNNVVNIHVPLAPGSITDRQFRWFHEVLGCVEQQNPAAGAVHDEFWPGHNDKPADEARIKAAKKRLQSLQEEIKHGRDALLEMNSCRQPFADQLAERIEAFERHSPFDLVETASDLLHFHFEETQQGVYSIIPTDNMLLPALPGVPPEGSEITFRRDLANQREDILFVSWDAPLVQGLWELLHYSELGSASVATLVSRQLPAGHCLLECCFDLLVQSPFSAACRPFLSAISLRSLALDISDKDFSELLPEASLNSSIRAVKRHLAREIVKSKKEEIPAWFAKCEQFAERQKQTVLQQAKAHVERHYGNETARLLQLQKRNDLIDDAEIESLKRRCLDLIGALEDNTHLHLSAIRLIVITDA